MEPLPLTELLAGFPPRRRAALLAEFQALDTPANEELIRFLRAVGIFTSIQESIPKRVAALLAEFAKSRPEAALQQADIEEIGRVAGENVKIPNVEAFHKDVKRVEEILLRIEAITASTADTRKAVAGLPAVLNRYRVQTTVAAFLSAFMFAGIFMGALFWWMQPKAMSELTGRGGELHFNAAQNSFILSGPFGAMKQDEKTGAIIFTLQQP
jgi:hypothetical protein